MELKKIKFLDITFIFKQITVHNTKKQKEIRTITTKTILNKILGTEN